MNEIDLKKEWLKRKFSSFAYHEEMLKEYWAAVDILDQHWSDPKMSSKEAQGECAGSQKPREWPGITKVMRTTGLFNLKQVSRPGTLSESEWRAGFYSGWANTVIYNFGAKGLGEILGDATETFGMSQAEADHYGQHVNKAKRMANNIRRTVEQTWDKHSEDTILDEKYTGPIAYPLNWENEVLGSLEIENEILTLNEGTRCMANHPCPRTGVWWTPARSGSRQQFQQGQIMPDFPDSKYGKTIWYLEKS